MHPKHYMLLLLATITLITTCIVCISIIDSLFNTHTSLSSFHLWDKLGGQPRRLIRTDSFTLMGLVGTDRDRRTLYKLEGAAVRPVGI